jgi:RNA polymerase primary sigma factor
MERRAIEAELPAVIERLKNCATRDGVVSRRAFATEAVRLGLTTDEQQRRLCDGLALMHIFVEPQPGVATGDRLVPVSGHRGRATAPRTSVTVRPAAVAAAPVSTANEAGRRLTQARRMLARYADAAGAVSKLVHDGVVHLFGLSSAEARQLAVDYPVSRMPGRTHHEALGVRARTTASHAPAPSTLPTTLPDAGDHAPSASPATDRALADAVRAARAVLEEDRWRREVGKVVLKAEEEVGLAALLRGSTDDLGRDVPEEEITALPRDGERWRAYECLVLHNTRLVWSIARQEFQGGGGPCPARVHRTVARGP